jgi:hypothetical protein
LVKAFLGEIMVARRRIYHHYAGWQGEVVCFLPTPFPLTPSIKFSKFFPGINFKNATPAMISKG